MLCKKGIQLSSVRAVSFPQVLHAFIVTHIPWRSNPPTTRHPTLTHTTRMHLTSKESSSWRLNLKSVQEGRSCNGIFLKCHPSKKDFHLPLGHFWQWQEGWILNNIYKFFLLHCWSTESWFWLPKHVGPHFKMGQQKMMRKLEIRTQAGCFMTFFDTHVHSW